MFYSSIWGIHTSHLLDETVPDIFWGSKTRCLFPLGLAHYSDSRYARSSGSGRSITNTIQQGVRTGGEGWTGLYRSFPITVMTNVPYGMIMMTTNEWIRGVLEDGLKDFTNIIIIIMGEIMKSHFTL